MISETVTLVKVDLWMIVLLAFVLGFAISAFSSRRKGP